MKNKQQTDLKPQPSGLIVYILLGLGVLLGLFCFSRLGKIQRDQQDLQDLITHNAQQVTDLVESMKVNQSKHQADLTEVTLQENQVQTAFTGLKMQIDHGLAGLVAAIDSNAKETLALGQWLENQAPKINQLSEEVPGQTPLTEPFGSGRPEQEELSMLTPKGSASRSLTIQMAEID